jgi:hypothetical protein
MGTIGKVLGALAVAGMAATGGTALTGAGLTTQNSAASAQYIGGTISQAVTGATLDSIAYHFADAPKLHMDSVTLTFANTESDGKTPTVAAGTGYGGGATQITCSAVEAVGHTSLCTPKDVDDLVTGYVTGLASIAVTVA